jgi:uncharacterized protein (UPF0335 family)
VGTSIYLNARSGIDQESVHANQGEDVTVVAANKLDKLVKELQSLQMAKARLEGEQKQLMKSLNELGFDSVEDASEELDRLDEFLRQEGSLLDADYEQFQTQYADAIQVAQAK